MINKQPILNGLVLAGGKSLRMGRDKSAIPWHGKEQQYYMADLLKPFCNEVFISRRNEQEIATNTDYKTLIDSYTGIGAYGAILSAFKSQPEAAWFVVACDLPLLDNATLEYLIQNRSAEKMATTFQSPFDGLPEPLITIWEPQSFEVILSFLANGYTCPRKVLIKSNNAHILQPPDADALMNVNTPEDFAKAEQLIHQRKEGQQTARYSCQLNLPGFGTERQLKLQNAKVLLVGAGGLGCPAAQYLAATGVGTIAIADFDTISTSNLHRQLLYTPSEVGLLKAEVACNKLQQQNPQITLLPITDKITSPNIMGIIKDYDIIVDCTDNFETKYLLNDACSLAGKPLVYAAIYQYEGQLSVLNTLNKDGTRSPNYRDIFPDVNAPQIPSCAEGGVLPTIAGIIGCMQANEVIKYITGTGELLTGKLLILDALTLQSRIIKTGITTKTTITALPSTEPIKLISVNELRNGMVDGLFELIDVRNIEERNHYHIGGKHIPFAEIETNLSLIDSNKPVVFYCQSGRRSAEAIRLINKQFESCELLSLDGGLKAWREKQFAAPILHSQAE